MVQRAALQEACSGGRGVVTLQQEGSHSRERCGNVWAKCEDQWEAWQPGWKLRAGPDGAYDLRFCSEGAESLL